MENIVKYGKAWTAAGEQKRNPADASERPQERRKGRVGDDPHLTTKALTRPRRGRAGRQARTGREGKGIDTSGKLTGPVLSVSQVAAHFGVCTRTVRNWIRGGGIKAGRPTERGPFFISREEVARVTGRKQRRSAHDPEQVTPDGS